jgi:hypothetical protein
MQALLGKCAAIIRKDPQGQKQLKDFMIHGKDETGIITLSDGKKFRISRSPLPKTEQKPVTA